MLQDGSGGWAAVGSCQASWPTLQAGARHQCCLKSSPVELVGVLVVCKQRERVGREEVAAEQCHRPRSVSGSGAAAPSRRQARPELLCTHPLARTGPGSGRRTSGGPAQSSGSCRRLQQERARAREWSSTDSRRRAAAAAAGGRQRRLQPWVCSLWIITELAVTASTAPCAGESVSVAIERRRGREEGGVALGQPRPDLRCSWGVSAAVQQSVHGSVE